MIDTETLGAVVSAISSAAGGALGELAVLVRSAVRRAPGGDLVLDEVQTAPGDVMAREALREHLQHAAADPVFSAELAHLVCEVRREGVTNNVAGTVSGPVVQAGTVHGGVVLGASYPAPHQRNESD